MSPPEDGDVEAKTATCDDLERVRNEEYKIWKKQSPFLYDVCISKALTSPSASVQWFPAPAVSASADSPFATYKMLLTSSELFGGPNAVYTATCDLPQRGANPDAIARASRENRSSLNIVRTEKVFPLQSSEFPLVARLSSADQPLIAVAGRNGFVRVFSSESPVKTEFLHHQQDVFDLAWNPHSQQEFVTVSKDGTAAQWHVNAASNPLATVFAGNNSAGHSESVSQAIYAVQYAPLNAHELVTAGDDRMIRFWDRRAPLHAHARAIKEAHATGISALDYSPYNEMLLATGALDGTVALWDVRMSSASLLGIQADAGPVNALKWSPHDESVLATGGADAQVKVWDLSRHNQPQTPAEEEEGPPELMFVHGGHLRAIPDLSWHPTYDWTLCSVSEDSLVGVWKIASAIVDEEDEESLDAKGFD